VRRRFLQVNAAIAAASLRDQAVGAPRGVFDLHVGARIRGHLGVISRRVAGNIVQVHPIGAVERLVSGSVQRALQADAVDAAGAVDALAVVAARRHAGLVRTAKGQQKGHHRDEPKSGPRAI